jgi:hypothetical protein
MQEQNSGVITSAQISAQWCCRNTRKKMKLTCCSACSIFFSSVGQMSGQYVKPKYNNTYLPFRDSLVTRCGMRAT